MVVMLLAIGLAACLASVLWGSAVLGIAGVALAVTATVLDVYTKKEERKEWAAWLSAWLTKIRNR